MQMRVNRSSQALLVTCAVLSGAANLAGQIASQRTAPQTSGLDTMPIVTKTRETIVVIGAAEASTPAAAEANSYRNAVYRAATEFNLRLFEDTRAPLSVSFAHLEDFIRRFGRVTGKQATPVKGVFRGYTRLEIHDTFLDPSRVRSMTTALSKLNSQQVEGYLLAPAARIIERASTEILVRRVPVRSATIRDGSFYFFFAIRASGGLVTARLERIEVEEDGSPGDAGWQFTITSNEAGAFRLPAQRFNNDRPVVPLAGDDKSRELTFTGSRPNLEIKIVGNRQ
jgi:hypothetical protein